MYYLDLWVQKGSGSVHSFSEGGASSSSGREGASQVREVFTGLGDHLW